VTLGVTSIVGSGGGDDITGGGVTITSIIVTPSAVPDGLPVDLTLQFTAIAEYSNNTQQDVTNSVAWTSSDTSVATISVIGLATGVAVGTTNITASMSGVTSNTVSLEVVNITLTKIEISPAIMPNDLPLGLSQQFTAMGTFDNTRSYDITEFVTWSSSDDAIAMIDSSGLVTSVAASATPAIITASASGETSNSVSLTVVNNKTASELIVEPQWIGALPVNRLYQLKALLRFSDNSTYDVTDRVAWSSNDESTAIVSNDSNAGPKGLVTAASPGRVTITAVDSLTAPSDSTIDVTNATIDSVTISPSAPNNLPAGYTQEFTAMGNISDGSTLKLTNPISWTVSDASLASFDQIGEVARVRGIAPGSVIVSYVDILADGTKSGQVGTVSLTINNATLQSILINPGTNFTLPTETQQQFNALGSFSDASSRDITNDVDWDSSSGSIAVFGVDAGKLTTTAPGSSNVVAQRLNSVSTLITSSPAVTVTVQDETLQSLTITPNPGTVDIGGTVQFTATATFSNIVTQVDYTERVYWSWSSNNFDFVTVSTAEGTKGQVTGIKAGGPFILNAEVPGLTVIPTPLTTLNVQ